ncbi:RluA family pseudouridine synthase [Christensenella tenuis]|uniref:Pseudouridine synthase n=1 Tax=Christensenella tenuis TaxID=2763033 RepID=A0ABR7EB00_9FIRM|nr:RluA family pseudouridine synthase [Christensenella tenuis]MBC5646925.1 RluA family pseudouridine synthase [Christensenella tenuis]
MTVLKSKVNSSENQRLDTYLVEKYPHFSRSFLKNAIDREYILLNGGRTKAGVKVKEGDEILLDLPKAEEISVEPQNIPIEIIYQDGDIAIINKPQGMVTHPAPGNYNGTLVNAIMYHMNDLSGINGKLRPGIVHRLDKDTSGLLVIAKNDIAHKALSEQIARKEAKRIYLALVYGNIKTDNGTVSTLIGRDPRDRKKMAVLRAGGRQAVTHYKVLERYGGYTLVECELETGRTHQIRVHMKHIGHPVVGDPVYSRQKDRYGLDGQLLHAKRLELIHPQTGEKMIFEAPLPEHFKAILVKLKKM